MKKKSLLFILVALSVLVFLGCPQTTDSPKDITISISEITGITPPEVGHTPPPTKITETPQYTGTVTWSPDASNGFKANTEYTATITLKAKKGYTLNGVTKDFFKVDGASVTNAANSGEVIVTFPRTLLFSLGMILVPAGRFQRDETSTNISVITKPYYMSQYQITRAQFLEIMGKDPSEESKSTSENDPVQQVNWYHAIAFCNKLSIKEGKQPVYSVKISDTELDWANLAFASIPTSSDPNWNAATQDLTKNGYRLPTEMEWMWAAMGAPSDGQDGNTNTTSYLKKFAGDDGTNTIDDYAWYTINSGSKTHPVGEKLPNELGIFDLSGNVWEWCWDWYGTIAADTQTNFMGAASGTYRVTRGGSLNFPASYCTVAYRFYYNPNSQSYDYGFRVVCSGD